MTSTMDSPLADLARFGQIPDTNPSVVAAKKAQVNQSSLMKQALFGSPEEQHKIATGVLVDAAVAQSREIKDLETLDPLAFAAKYGAEAQLNRHRWAKAQRGLDEFKDRDRTTSELINDSIGDVAGGIVTGVGGILQVPAILGDAANAAGGTIINGLAGKEIFSRPEKSLSNYVAKGTEAVRGAVQDRQSGYLADERMQEAMEMAILREQNEAEAAQERAQKSGQGWLAETAIPEARLVAKNFGDALSNMADSPATIGSTFGEGVGSIVTAGALTRGLTAVTGATAAQAAAPAMMITESGSANNQTQGAIMEMTPAQLAGNPVYEALRAQGLSHDASVNQMAADAGGLAQVLAAPGALLAGKVAAPIVAKPLTVGASGFKAAPALGRNMLSEGTEELLQESNSQIASNVAQRTSAGLDVALSDGVGEGAAMGLVGGVTSAGGLQAPGAALKVTGAAAKAAAEITVGTAEDLMEARKAGIERKLDGQSVVGSTAQAETAQTINEVGQQLVAALPETTPNQTEEGGSLRDKVSNALFLSNDEAAAFEQVFPALAARRAANPEAPIERKALINEFGNVLKNKDASNAERRSSALTMFEVLEEMRQVGSDAVQENLPEETRALYAQLDGSLKTAESDPIFKEAEAVLRELTADTITDVVDTSIFSNADADPEAKAYEAMRLELISRVNPGAVTPELLGLALNQVGGGKGREMLMKRLSTAKTIAEEFIAADKAKEDLLKEQDAAIAGMSPDLQKRLTARKHGTYDIVREEIQLTGNSSNKLPSLAQHRRVISDAASAGRMTEAQDQLTDLANFAESQVNKVTAMNASARTAAGRNGAVEFMAYNGTSFFKQKPVWVDAKNPLSVAQAREAAVDAKTAVALATSLADVYGLKLPKALVAPDLDLTAVPAKTVAPVAEADVDLVDTGDTFDAPTPVAVAPVAPVVADVPAAAPTTAPVSAAPKAVVAAVPAGTTPASGIDPKTGLKTKEQASKDWDAFEARLNAVPAVTLTGKTQYAAKDQKKADRANKFIGRGSVKSSTNQYAKDFGALANVGTYTAEDTVFISSEGARRGRVAPDFAEIQRAMDAGATLITDGAADRNRTYNIGEQEVAMYLSNHGYTEQESGTWTPTPKQITAPQTAQIAATPTEVTAEPAPDAVTPWFNSLANVLPKSTEGRNVLLSAFRPRKDGSQLVAQADPAAYVRDNITEVSKASGSLSRELTDDERTNVLGMLDKPMTDFIQRFKEGMNALIAKRNDKDKWGDMLASGTVDKVLSYDNALPMNFVTGKDADGNFEIEPRVMQATYMAAMDWLFESATRGKQRLDKERVSKMFGMGRNGRVTTDMTTIAQNGIPLQSAVEALATRIEEMLGVSQNPDAPINETQGLFRSMAANALGVMIKEGDLVEEEIGYQLKDRRTGKESPRKMIFLQASKTARDASSIKVLGALGSPFAKIFVPGFEKERFIGEAPKQVTSKQIGNRFSEISDKARKVIERLQKAPSYVNQRKLGLIDALGDETYLRMLGHKTVDDALRARTNKVDLASIEGKNASLERGLAESRRYAEEAGTKPIFFRWVLSSVGRLQQVGPITPQGDKIARELIAATNSTLNLDNPVHRDVLMLAVGQSIGVSIEKMTTEEAIEATMEALSALQPAVDILQNWMRGQGDLTGFEAAVANARDGKGKPFGVTPKLIHALHTVALANEEKGTDAGRAFQTSLALEADGKTDGPINAMIHMATGLFTPKDIERYAKGGFFFTSKPMSLNQFIAEEYARHGGKKTKAEDLYHLTAARLEEMLASDPEALKEALPVLRVLDAFLPDFTMTGTSVVDADSVIEDVDTDPLEVKVGRNVVKNPLTVFLYGSGEDGIANKLTNAALDTFYGVLSEIAAGKADGTLEKGWMSHPLFQKNPGLLNDLATMFGKTPHDMAVMLANPVTTELDAAAFESFSGQLLESFAQPMLEAVDQVTGGLATNMKILQGMAQAQTLIFQDLYDQAQTAQADESGKKFPTKAELDETFISLMGMAPIYQTEDQSFQIAGPEKETLDAKVSMTFGGRFPTRATGLRPADASVKISPYLTIGTGDGQMLLNAMDQEEVDMERSLLVFDGVEQALDQVGEMSQAINKSVYDGWMGSNNYRAALQGFEQLLTRLTPEMFDSLSPETMAQLKRALGGKKEDPMPTLDGLANVARIVGQMADSQDFRKAAIAQMATSTDHMAGVQAPFVSAGETTANDDPQNYVEIAQALNALYAAEKAAKADRTKAKNTEAKTANYAEAPDAKLLEHIQKVGKRMPGHEGVTVLTGRALVQLLTATLPNDRKGLLKDLARGGDLFNDHRFYFGSDAELAAMRDDFHPDASKDPVQLGITDLGEGISLITNVAAETILHELLHARTAQTVAGHYADPANSPQHVQIATRHLEGLMAEVRGFAKVNEAVAVLQDELNKLEGNPAAQLMEFISYMLTNQDLIELGKSQNTYQRLGRIVRAGMKLLKQLLGLRHSDMPGKDIFSNVRFNTEVLMKDVSLPGAQTAMVLSQADGSGVFDENEMLGHIERRYQARLNQLATVRRNALLKDGLRAKEAKDLSKKEVAEFLANGHKTAERAIAAGFRMSPRERQAFRVIHGAFQSSMVLNPALVRQLHSLHDHVLEKLSVELLTQDGKTLPEEAAAQIAFLQNARDNDMLASFMALAQVSPSLRSVLSGMTAPIGAELKWDSVDNAVTSVSAGMMSLLTRATLEKPGRLGSVGKELDRLGGLLSAVETENRILTTISQMSDKVEMANDYASKYLDVASKKASGFMSQRQTQASNQVTKVGFSVLGFVAAMGSKDASAARGESLTTFFNNIEGWDTVRSALHDLRGATKTNIPLLRLINQVKAKVDALRQDFREGVPKTLAKEFSRKLSRQEWSALHTAMGTTDIMALGLTEARALLRDPSSLTGRINAAEETVAGLSRPLADRYRLKAKALATYMVKGDVTSEHLLTNARAIAHLFGEGDRPDPATVGDDLIQAIERLVSLYAFEQLDEQSRATVQTLAEKEAKGMEAVSGLLASVRELERQKSLPTDQMEADLARNNAIQGWIPSLSAGDAQVIVADDSEQSELRMRGWVRIGTYQGDRKEGVRVSQGYYQSTVAGKAAFRQGVAQTVHATYGGVNLRTGQLLSGTATSLRGTRAQRIGQQIEAALPGSLEGRPAGEYLIPRFDGAGRVVAYDRPLMRDKTLGLQKDTHMGRMLGVWMGRMFEEQAAHEFNRTLLETLHEMAKDDIEKGRGGELVNVAAKNHPDPIIRDAWATMGAQLKSDAAEIFGQDNYLPVRKELVNDAIGYRSASITDMWTGETRVSEPVRNAVKEIATMIAGEKAYGLAKRTEGVIQDAVSYAKTTIIVRSAQIGVQNILSNILHLTLKGVPVTAIAGNGRKKLLEIQEYVKNAGKIQELQIKLAAQIQDPKAAAEVTARIHALEAANARMSIAPLLKAGEFSTISEDLTEADVAIREGRWADHLEKAVNKLPGGVSTVARNVLVTKDTALFQSLNRMVQYGDFVAKAVLYDHLIAKGKTEREALDVIMEEFVQYNRLPGRGRETLENLGALWFWNYTLRIMKVTANTARERPLSALMMMGAAGPAAGVDSVFSGSLVGKYLDGSLGFSIGPEMGFRAPSLNPWWSMLR